MTSKLLVGIWAVSVVLGIIAEWSFGLPRVLTVVLPAIYLPLSLIIFDKFALGYRIFHLMCIVPLLLYFLLGLPKLFNSSLPSYLAYIWYSSINSAYIFFLIMFGIAYLPYWISRKTRPST